MKIDEYNKNEEHTKFIKLRKENGEVKEKWQRRKDVKRE